MGSRRTQHGSETKDDPKSAAWLWFKVRHQYQLWSEPVLHARCTGAVSQGVGTERVCELAGNTTISERWVAWVEGRSFTYEGSGIPLMQRAVNRWSVIPQGERALLTSEAALTIKGGVLGSMLEPILGPLMRRMAPNALAGFKYLVEHGHPYDGKASELPKVPATC
jgi:polyketide cyclase/dehydrase/lipid transport protein